MEFQDWLGKKYTLPKNRAVYWRPSAYGLIIKNNQILLIQSKIHGLWELPGGGIELNENMLEALHREVYEETGYKIAPLDNHPLYIEDNYFYAPESDKYYKSIPIVFLAKPKGSNKNAQPIYKQEISKMKWFDIDKLPKEINPITVRAIKKYLKDK